MNRPADQIKKVVEHTLPWLVMAILLFYSYVDFFQHPFGFGWGPDGEVYAVFTPQPAPSLSVGDRLIAIGPLTWDAFSADLTKSFFAGVKPGQTVPITIQRNNQILTVQWTLPGMNSGEVVDQLFSEWFLAFVFWLFGTLALLLLRPRDERWRLLIAFYYLTAIWLIAGTRLSNDHIWYRALVLRIAIWISIPVYLWLHWVVPRPLGRLPRGLIGFASLAVLGLVIAQWFQILPQNLYYIGFLLSLLGSLILLVIHLIRQPEFHQEMRLLWVAIFYSLVPLFLIAPLLTNLTASFLNGTAQTDTLALITVPVLPSIYFYSAYRRQLGGLEMRVNRIISAYLFIVLLGGVGIPLFAFADRWFPSTDDTLIIGGLGTLLAAALSIWIFPRFQNFVEQHLLGIPLPFGQIQQAYSTGITDSISLKSLTNLLNDVMLPSLLVRQFCFLYFDRDYPKVLLAVGVDVKADELSKLSTLKDLHFNDHLKIGPYPWVKLMLPLRVGKDVLGFWLFGRRDPDDFYSQKDLPILRSLADQTAIALSNILQTERLHAAYQDGIQRSDIVRQQISLELHDSVLNRMAAIMMKLDDRSMTPEIQASYTELTGEVRKIIRELRPVMLNYGLQPAIEAYVDTLIDQMDGRVRVGLDLKSDGSRYSQEVEQHLFRIVQEACMNARRHSNPTLITLSGQLRSDLIELTVEDNGSGFNPKEILDLNALQAGNHFGLSGMFERAELVGAEIAIESEGGKGTRVRVRWKPNGE
ncbi:MAG TPA: ATP-binding protein [Anaerolineales bacterium]|nr:ATP-binding protein [Anaerolineales bacterium]